MNIPLNTISPNQKPNLRYILTTYPIRHILHRAERLSLAICSSFACLSRASILIWRPVRSWARKWFPREHTSGSQQFGGSTIESESQGFLLLQNLERSQSPSIQVLSRYFQVSWFEVRNSYHNPISVPQGLWCSALVAHLHPHWRSNAMFHVTWCLSETSQLSRQQ